MHRRPDRNLATLATAIAVLPLLGGCVQATRHSNTMVFGTNTTVGLKVGRDVNQMPVVMIAYDRQEAVIMPLLANTSEKHSVRNMLSPCAPVTETTTNFLTEKVTVTQTMDGKVSFGQDNKASVHPCKFIGVRATKDKLLIQDSYSVLASFGARIEGDASDTKGSVGIAQYFATGVAAQTLAMTGGAAVVSVGQAAEKAAENKNAAASAAAAVGADATALAIQADPGFTSDPTVAGKITELNEAVALRVSQTDFSNLNARLTAFDSDVKNRTNLDPAIAGLCSGAKTSADCADRIKTLRPLGSPGLYNRRQDILAALNSWTLP